MSTLPIARSWGAIVVAVYLFLFDQMKSLFLSSDCCCDQEFQSDCLHSGEWLFSLRRLRQWLVITSYTYRSFPWWWSWLPWGSFACNVCRRGRPRRRMEQERDMLWLHASFDLIIHLSVAGFVSGIHLCDLICFLSHHHHVISFSLRSLFLSFTFVQSEREIREDRKEHIIKREKKNFLRSSTEWKWRRRKRIPSLPSLIFLSLKTQFDEITFDLQNTNCKCILHEEGEFLLSSSSLCCSLILISSSSTTWIPISVKAALLPWGYKYKWMWKEINLKRRPPTLQWIPLWKQDQTMEQLSLSDLLSPAIVRLSLFLFPSNPLRLSVHADRAILFH